MKAEEKDKKRLMEEAKKLASERHHTKAGDIYASLGMYFKAACEYAQPDWIGKMGYFGAAIYKAREILRKHSLTEKEQKKLAEIAIKNEKYSLAEEIYERFKDIEGLTRLAEIVEKEYGAHTQANVIRRTLKELKKELEGVKKIK